jgi:hypothetical protein
MTVYDPLKRVLIEETFQIYKVGMAPKHGSDRRYEVRASSFHSAALLAADQAHMQWAWECDWPLQFIVTDQSGRSRCVEVDREIDPRFVVTVVHEVGEGQV